MPRPTKIEQLETELILAARSKNLPLVRSLVKALEILYHRELRQIKKDYKKIEEEYESVDGRINELLKRVSV